MLFCHYFQEEPDGGLCREHEANPATAGQTKRALATAMLFMGGGCGGIVASFAFQSKDAPDYIPGMIAAITSQAITVVLVSLNWAYFLHQNKKADKGEVVLEETPESRYTY